MTAGCPETGTPHVALQPCSPQILAWSEVARFVLWAAAVQPPTTLPALSRAPEALPPSNVIALPLILLLGCDPEVEARCRSIGLRARVLVRAMSLPFQRSEVASMAPLVIIVPAPVYEGAPWGFEVLAEKVGASLLMLDRDPMAPIVLEYRMMEALVFATRLRSRVREALQAR